MFKIAESTGCTVSELGDKLDVEELAGWIDYFQYNASKEKEAAAKAKAGAKAPSPRSNYMGR